MRNDRESDLQIYLVLSDDSRFFLRNAQFHHVANQRSFQSAAKGAEFSIKPHHHHCRESQHGRLPLQEKALLMRCAVERDLSVAQIIRQLIRKYIQYLRRIIVDSITVDCREGKIDPMSPAFIQMSGVFAELELSMIRALVRSGMENAKAKGKKVGMPKSTREHSGSVS